MLESGKSSQKKNLPPHIQEAILKGKSDMLSRAGKKGAEMARINNEKRKDEKEIMDLYVQEKIAEQREKDDDATNEKIVPFNPEDE